MDGADWLAAELSVIGCAACGQPYHHGGVRVLAGREGLCFVDLTCTACQVEAVAIVVDQDGEPLPPVTVDDLLAVHALLEMFEGDAHELLATLDGSPR